MVEGIKVAMRGVAMGVAEVIPGVSGGTIAFITGIYERLINAIKSIGPEAISGFQKGGVKGLWGAIDGNFLAWLMSGMGLGILVGIFGVTHLMETKPEALWGFFFGLILISCYIIAKEVPKWDFKAISMLLVGALTAYFITVSIPAEGSLNPLYIFMSAMIAVSALMLPGISGSFVLLLLGMYTLIIPEIKHFLSSPNIDSARILFVFGLGLLAGLAIFSRVLTWLFDHYKSAAMALLTGFMLGSLNKIWPWRNVSSIADKDTGQVQTITDYNVFLQLDKESYKIIKETNVFPSEYLNGDAQTGLVIVSVLVGAIGVFLLDYFGNKK